jgi:hypothetical protein
MITVGLQRIAILAQGINNWEEATALLKGDGEYRAEALPVLKPTMLKPNERRRTTKTIKIALQVAEEALRDVTDTEDLLSVFSSSEGDLDIIDQICIALSQPDRPVSPTQFHNSVHNAPAGYWSIGSGSRQGSSSLAGLDGGFAAGLMEAAVQCSVEQKPVLMVAYDQTPPHLLEAFMPIKAAFSVAMLLTPEAKDCIARLSLQPITDGDESQMQDSALEKLRLSAPAARSLPLLEKIAQQHSAQIVLPYLPGLNLQTELKPC